MFDFGRFADAEVRNRTFPESEIIDSTEEMWKHNFFFKKTQKLIFLCFLLKKMLSQLPKIRFPNFQKTRFAVPRSIET